MTDELPTFLSLGAGVQSSTLALMCAAGEIEPMPQAAIFADTQAEPKAVYEWLDWLEPRLPFPVYRVTEGDLAAEIGRPRKTGAWPVMPIPAFIEGANGKAAPINRSCTQDFKLKPIRRKVRELLGIAGKRSPDAPAATQFIGISLDEFHRMKPSREAWIKHRWPLVEKRITRTDCIAWMKARGLPSPPKSACTFCPYHDAAQWRAIRDDPSSWAQATEIDERIRELWRGRGGRLFLHRSMKPLALALAEPVRDDGQGSLFGNECEGMCGV